MKRTIVVALVMILLPAFANASATLDTIANAFGAGKVSGNIGMIFRADDADNPAVVDNGDIGMAFVELDFESSQFHNFTAGLNFIAVGELWSNDAWEDNGFSNDGNFEQNSILRHAYLTYDLPGTKTSVLVGRDKFKKSKAMDGDAHQGVQITSKDFQMTTLYMSVINRWINNATTDYDMDGIQNDWREGDDAFDGASSTTYSLIAEIEAIEGQLTLTPFFSHQSDVITNYGVNVECKHVINDDLSIVLDGTYAFYGEDSLDPNDEDASAYLAQATFGYKEFWAGAGYYVMSDDLRVGSKAVGNQAFDPMEEGVYGGDPDDNTIFLYAGYSHGPYEVEIMLGDTEVDSSATGEKAGATEFDVYFAYEITEAFALDLMFVNVDDDDSDKDYQVYAGGISMTF